MYTSALLCEWAESIAVRIQRNKPAAATITKATKAKMKKNALRIIKILPKSSGKNKHIGIFQLH
jgi:hypothetical protein